jgi:hypothetical protein
MEDMSLRGVTPVNHVFGNQIWCVAVAEGRWCCHARIARRPLSHVEHGRAAARPSACSHCMRPNQARFLTGRLCRPLPLLAGGCPSQWTPLWTRYCSCAPSTSAPPTCTRLCGATLSSSSPTPLGCGRQAGTGACGPVQSLCARVAPRREAGRAHRCGLVFTSRLTVFPSTRRECVCYVYVCLLLRLAPPTLGKRGRGWV